MYRFYLAAVDMLPGALILMPVFWILNWVYFHNLWKSILYYLFACYLAVVYVLVGLPNIACIRIELNLNLIPFAGMLGDWKNSILNVLLFVPLGIILPILWRNFKKAKSTVLFGFLMSCAIELLQILTYRATDVNDLITNTFGTFLGFLFAKAVMSKFTILKHLVNEERTAELCIVIVTVLLSMFFVYPFISAVLWDFILL